MAIKLNIKIMVVPTLRYSATISLKIRMFSLTTRIYNILYARIFSMKRIVINILLLILMSSVMLSASTQEEDRYSELRNRYNELKQDKKKRQYRVYWSNIAKELNKLSETAEPKLKVRIYFTLGEVYRDLRKITLSPYDFDSAIEYYRKVYTEFPNSNLADDALYYTGKLYLEVENDTDTAIKFFKRIRDEYKKGDCYEKAITILNSVPDSDLKEVTTTKKEEEKTTKEESVKPEEVEREETTQETSQKVLSELKEMKLQIGESGAICELFTTSNVRYVYKELPEDPKNAKPPRIYIDLIDTKLGANIEKTKNIENGFLKAIRLGQFADNTVRIVFDLASIQTYLIYTAEEPYRIVMHFGDLKNVKPILPEADGGWVMKEEDVGYKEKLPESQKVEKVEKGKDDAINMKIVESVKSDLKKNISEKKTDSIPLSKQLGLKVKRIVIDPGHGGDDTGAVGKSGLKEKDVVLDIALELARIIKKNTDIEVILTRDSDTTLKLSERAAMAREKKADLFISIHANANKNKKFSGVEVYYLNNTDDRASQKVAMLENVNSDKSISDLKMTLLDLAISANVDESMRLANFVQGGIVSKLKQKYPDVKDRGVKYALFYVLFGTEIPSILVETSFISNPVEEKRFKNKEYKRLIAEGIYEGIIKYIGNNDL